MPSPVAVTTSPTPSRGAAICPSPALTTDSTTPSASLSVNSSDQCLMRAFGASVCDTTLLNYSENEWVRQWSAIAHLKGCLYHLPGGSKCRRYVDQLSVEMSHLAVGNFPSKRIMVFSAIILQCNCMVKKGSDIRRVIDERLSKWCNDEFDVLVEEAARCDTTLKSYTYKTSDDHFISVFSRLMLFGKIKVAIRWLSEQSKGRVLPSDSFIDVKNGDGSSPRISVLDALRRST